MKGMDKNNRLRLNGSTFLEFEKTESVDSDKGTFYLVDEESHVGIELSFDEMLDIWLFLENNFKD